jgi:phosphoribosyl 1,2-cyclic phosphodiesterase
MKITFLGVNSIPTKDNNGHSILINDNILVDCAENTQRQLLTLNIKGIDHIFLTHDHIDHLIGLPGVLLQYRRPVTIYGSKATIKTAKAFLRLFEHSSYKAITWVEMCHSLRVEDIQVRVMETQHCKGCLAYQFEHEKIFSLMWDLTSGYVEEYSKFISNSDVLVIDEVHIGLDELKEVISSCQARVYIAPVHRLIDPSEYGDVQIPIEFEEVLL